MSTVDYLLRDQTREVQVSPNEWLCTDVTQGEMLWVKTASFGGVECWGYAISLHYTPPFTDPDGRSYPEFVHMTVHLELPHDHPSVVEAMAETGMSYAEIELHDSVSLKDLRHNGTPENGWQERPVRVWRRGISENERAERARRRKLDRPAFPELDLGLRNIIPNPPRRSNDDRNARS